jgi:Ca2+-binding RTX toxin-like protein
MRPRGIFVSLATTALIVGPAFAQGIFSSVAGARAECSIRGTAADDTLYGTTRDDVICSKAGSDTVYGDEGDDSIRLGQSHDSGYGGEGADGVKGQDDDDLVYGGGMNDKVYGGQGNDSVYGEGGDDFVKARTQTRVTSTPETSRPPARPSSRRSCRIADRRSAIREESLTKTPSRVSAGVRSASRARVGLISPTSASCPSAWRWIRGDVPASACECASRSPGDACYTGLSRSYDRQRG